MRAPIQRTFASIGGPGQMNEILPVIDRVRHGETAWSLTGRPVIDRRNRRPRIRPIRHDQIHWAHFQVPPEWRN